MLGWGGDNYSEWVYRWGKWGRPAKLFWCVLGSVSMQFQGINWVQSWLKPDHIGCNPCSHCSSGPWTMGDFGVPDNPTIPSGMRVDLFFFEEGGEETSADSWVVDSGVILLGQSFIHSFTKFAVVSLPSISGCLGRTSNLGVLGVSLHFSHGPTTLVQFTASLLLHSCYSMEYVWPQRCHPWLIYGQIS